MRAPHVREGQRNLAAESIYEFGSRVGFWCLYWPFTSCGVPLTVFASAMVLERCPDLGVAIAATDWDICAHGLRRVEHYNPDLITERHHIARAYDIIIKLIGRATEGW